MSAEAKVVAVSGAASGIGEASVRELIAAGYAVIGLDLAELPSGLAGLERLEWVRGDVTDPAAWEQVERRCRERDPEGAWGFVACAADVSVAPLLETPLEEWRRLHEINVLGVVAGMKALIPAMVARGAGAVAVTCSVNSHFVERDISAYSASKAGLLSATRSAALEHARDGIRINAVLPGIVDTPLLSKHVDSTPDPEGMWAGMRKRLPTGEITTPAEVAKLLVFLVGDGASGLSGAALTVDGGLTTTYEF